VQLDADVPTAFVLARFAPDRQPPLSLREWIFVVATCVFLSRVWLDLSAFPESGPEANPLSPAQSESWLSCPFPLFYSVNGVSGN